MLTYLILFFCLWRTQVQTYICIQPKHIPLLAMQMPIDTLVSELSVQSNQYLNLDINFKYLANVRSSQGTLRSAFNAWKGASSDVIQIWDLSEAKRDSDIFTTWKTWGFSRRQLPSTFCHESLNRIVPNTCCSMNLSLCDHGSCSCWQIQTLLGLLGRINLLSLLGLTFSKTDLPLRQSFWRKGACSSSSSSILRSPKVWMSSRFRRLLPIPCGGRKTCMYQGVFEGLLCLAQMTNGVNSETVKR